MRCCPYCLDRPVEWRYYGGVVIEAGRATIDLKSERPWCSVHGPVGLWLVVDFDSEPSPAIVAIATVNDLPCVIRDGERLARVLPRFLREPLLVSDARPLGARWKRTQETRLRQRKQDQLLPIDLATIRRVEWKRRAA